MFISTVRYFNENPDYSEIRSLLHTSLPIARGAAAVLNLCSAFLLLPMCRNLISLARRIRFLKRVIPFDDHIEFHKIIACSIVFWTGVHIIAHFFNFIHFYDITGVTPESLAVLSGPGYTGQVVTVILFLIVTSSLESVRKTGFEIFWFTHHLMIVWFAFMLLHGTFGFVKKNDGTPTGANFWKWWLGSAVVYFIDRVCLRYIPSMTVSTRISKVVLHPSNVIELQILKQSTNNNINPGQYVFICIPELARFEWHPFTLTCAPEDPYLSVHMRVVGDWTRAVSKRLGCDDLNNNSIILGDDAVKFLPKIYVDGPFGASSEDVFDYEVAICVGAGIGVTPFASILKSIYYKALDPNTYLKLRQVYFIWTCRDKEAFEWFHDLLVALESDESISGLIEIHSYMTGSFKPNEIENLHNNSNLEDGLTGLKTGTKYGRPNWPELFARVGKTHPGADVGVFFCGPRPLSDTLLRHCNEFTDSTVNGAKFYFHKENF